MEKISRPAPAIDGTSSNSHSLGDLEFNERFEFLNVFSMEMELAKSLKKGLPYPILKIIEYLSVDRAGFVWGRQYRLTGYYTMCMLWTAFSFWIIQMLTLFLLPHCFGKMVLVVGVLILSSDLIYYTFLPKNLQIRFPSPNGSMSVLQFHLSGCFYATFFAGLTSIIFGGILLFLQMRSLYTLKTFLSCYIDEHCFVMNERRPRRPSLGSLDDETGISGLSIRHKTSDEQCYPPVRF